MAERAPVGLGHLAGLLFGSAANWWYGALAVEAVAAVASGAIGLTAPAGTPAAIATLLVVMLIVGAYVARLRAESRQDTAQTMRRQAALSEGLGWRVTPAQADEWRRRAGPGLLRKAASKPRDPHYYSSTSPVGPRRLAEMTRESAFYTRHLWLGMRDLLLLALVVVLLILGVAVYLALALQASAGIAAVVAQVAATVVLLAIALDLVGWVLRLNRQADAVHAVEDGLDRVLEVADPKPEDVLRLVSEYDCELVSSIPIHSVFFAWKHDGIEELWAARGGE